MTGTHTFGTTALSSVVTAGETSFTTCTPDCIRPLDDLCIQSTDDGCGGQCPWVVKKKYDSKADTNCDDAVSDSEIGEAALKWIAFTAPFNDNLEMVKAISAWSDSP